MHVVTIAGPHELWVVDLEKGIRFQVPTHGHPSNWLQWWPTGDAVVFTEFAPNGGLPGVVVLQSLTEPSRRDTLAPSAIFVDPAPNGKTLAVLARPTHLELRSSSARSETLERSIRFARFSPDSKWLAYTEDIDNESEVYVTPVARPSQRYKISAAGGEEPVWSPDGRSIVFRHKRNWFKAEIKAFSPFRTDQPRLLFQGPFVNVPGIEHDISTDGRRQLVLLGPPGDSTTKLVVVTNWFAELNRMRQLTTAH
jgi:Tol biopolymer transport system component